MTTLEFIPVPIRATPTKLDTLTINSSASPYITQSSRNEVSEDSRVVQETNKEDWKKILGIIILTAIAFYILNGYGK